MYACMYLKTTYWNLSTKNCAGFISELTRALIKPRLSRVWPPRSGAIHFHENTLRTVTQQASFKSRLDFTEWCSPVQPQHTSSVQEYLDEMQWSVLQRKSNWEITLVPNSFKDLWSDNANSLSPLLTLTLRIYFRVTKYKGTMLQHQHLEIHSRNELLQCRSWPQQVNEELHELQASLCCHLMGFLFLRGLQKLRNKDTWMHSAEYPKWKERQRDKKHVA